MKINKKNKIVACINIIGGILCCINWLIISNCMKMENIYYINFINEQDIITMVSALLMIIPIVTTFIVNLIYIFRNWHNKKSMILNILTIINIIIAVVLTFIFESYKYMYIISIIVILGILLLIFNKNEEEGKKHKVLFSLIIINIILFIISIIGCISVNNDYQVSYANNEKNLIKNIMQISNETNTNIPIKAKKNGKWGYIDLNGNVIVDFIYDDSTEFIEINNLDNNNKYYLAPISKGNELQLITNDNKKVASFKNKKREKTINCKYILYDLTDDLKTYAKSANVKIKVNTSNYDKTYLYNESVKEEKYESNIGYNLDNNILSFDINTENELSYNTKTKSIRYNNRKISINGNLYIHKNEDKNNDYSYNSDSYYLDTYKNGYVPLYNFEEDIFGWIDLKGKTHYINGKLQILDFADKHIAVKDYSLDNDTNICIMDYKGNVVSDYYQEITVLENGFVVKKENGKNVYLDENFEEKTEEYDIIDTCRANEGILIVSNLYRKAKNTDNLNDLRFDVINLSSYRIVSKDLEYINGMNDYKYNENNYYDITDKEFKEILCTVNCNYLNTKLYEEHYK